MNLYKVVRRYSHSKETIYVVAGSFGEAEKAVMADYRYTDIITIEQLEATKVLIAK